MPESPASAPSLAEFRSGSPAETEAAGALLARRLVAGDRLALFGDLGAGKTAFVRGVAAGLGADAAAEVASPTFALHHRYPGGRLVVDHCDLYRLRAPVDPAAEGFDDLFDRPPGVLIVEWPERLPAAYRFTLAVRIEASGEETRRLILTAVAAAADRLRGAFS